MRILLVEDDPRQATFIMHGLQQEGICVDHAVDGEAGLQQALAAPYDLFVFDLMLPVRDGLSLIHAIRGRGITAPILVLSARNSVDDRVKGLQAGGDDYLVKPFAFSELLARVQALYRRATGMTEPTQLTHGSLRLDLQRRKCWRDDDTLDLQPKEFALLEYLMRNAGRVVSRTMIMEHVWDYNFDPQTNVVEARISRLREKVDRPFAQPLIHTVRGIGYMLEARN
ncbi:MAG: DNA-binding response regulator [Zetaproteobacteria bacterium CG12_big_fil_rev_8_21_14_0_65_54_13]|nr:MAG: DNA-binding response regulator [Zetaproteobacteria bacterium CG12_big_fil_rev_8_21_14_0_65_54_13]PIX55741.1 MAG: DNA-binding response regulator [Zetaproteobacteria bacterium CG_4_10_14_3_um_filter_54_28]PJA30553.1 MAG: DNA-binding response regulator [Zetaproteobacteria bacterium CG_4_9_14_3_um_filter_54_145]